MSPYQQIVVSPRLLARWTSRLPAVYIECPGDLDISAFGDKTTELLDMAHSKRAEIASTPGSFNAPIRFAQRIDGLGSNELTINLGLGDYGLGVAMHTLCGTDYDLAISNDVPRTLGLWVVVRSSDGLVPAGRRSPHAQKWPNTKAFPSEGIGSDGLPSRPLDLEREVAKCLREELGLDLPFTTIASALYDLGAPNSYCFMVAVELAVSSEEIRAVHANADDGWELDLEFIDPCNDCHDGWVPGSQEALALLR